MVRCESSCGGHDTGAFNDTDPDLVEARRRWSHDRISGAGIHASALVLHNARWELERRLKLRFEQFVAAPREHLFEFHSTPANLAQLLSGWKGFALLQHEGHIRPGSRVRLAQRVALLRHEMEFEHFLLEPPLRFAERQTRGPFRRFEHLHEFFEEPHGSRIVDTIEFELPWFLGGRLAELLVAKPVLTRFFDYRRGAYRRLCESGGLETSVR